MGRKKVPTAVLRATGSRHYSKVELAEREAGEIKAPPAEKLEPPSYLTGQLARKFRKLAPLLMQMGILSELDVDGLARYLIAEANYLRATSRLTSALNTGELGDAAKLASMQDRFFRQCRAAGADLGLTVSSRCNLVLPESTLKEPDQEEADLFGE